MLAHLTLPRRLISRLMCDNAQLHLKDFCCLPKRCILIGRIRGMGKTKKLDGKIDMIQRSRAFHICYVLILRIRQGGLGRQHARAINHVPKLRRRLPIWPSSAWFNLLTVFPVTILHRTRVSLAKQKFCIVSLCLAMEQQYLSPRMVSQSLPTHGATL